MENLNIKEQEWLKNQPEITIFEYTINNIQDGYTLLKQHGIFGVKALQGCFNKPYSSLITVPLKENIFNLAFIYIQPRPNPFNKTYTYQINQTLNHFKQQKLTIQTIFIFKFNEEMENESLIDEIY